MGWGNASNISTTNLDNANDDPSLARNDLYLALLELAAVIGGRNTSNGVCPLDASTKVPNTNLPNTLISSSGNNLTLTPNTGRVIINDILKLNPKTVSELEALTVQAGDIAYCSNGDAGSPCIAVSLGITDSSGLAEWYRISLGSIISAT
jgi:hypothetical protein